MVMDNDDKYYTPSRKLSLRRKRSTKIDENSESPLHKKTSPSSTRGVIKDVNPGNSNGDIGASQVYHTRRTAALQASITMTGYSTPKITTQIGHHIARDEDAQQLQADLGKSTKNSKNAKRSSELEEQRTYQHSPDTPFMSSQLCGTQECEVVWDCNSPGFSKDDLKRMSRKAEEDDCPSPFVPEFVAPVPPWPLAPKARSRNTNNTTAVNTTAQLDELLSQLAAKGTLQSEKKSLSSHVLSLQEGNSVESLEDVSLYPNTPPADKDSQPASSPIPPELFRKGSSQPFSVESVPKEMENSDGDLEDAWDSDLNAAICGTDDLDLISDSQCKATNVKVVGHGPSPIVEKTDNGSDSVDIFDDDFFNESLIATTQAMENEILEKEAVGASKPIVTNTISCSKKEYVLEHPGSNRSSSKADPSSGLFGSRTKVNGMNKSNNERKSCIPSDVISNGLKTRGSSNKQYERLKINPALRQPHERIDIAEKPPQRRVRNSFRLHSPERMGPTDQATSKSAVNDKGFTVANKINGAVSDSVTDNDKTIKSGKFSIFTRNNVHDTTQNSTRSRSNLEPKSKLFQPRKALFVGGTGRGSSFEKTDSRSESAKNSFPRSLSTDNATPPVGKVSMMARPSKSEDMEGSREFEEDNSFFESLLSTLPEDDMMLGVLKSSEVPQQKDTKTVTTGRANGISSLAERQIGSRSFTSNSDEVNHKVGPQPERTSVKSFSVSANAHSKANLKSSSSCMSAVSKSSSAVDGGQKPFTASVSSMIVSKKEVLEASSSDLLDDDLFEDDILSLIDEVESQFGSQPQATATSSSQSSQLSLSQQSKCTADEIARKKEEAKRRREEKQKREEMARKKEEAQRKLEEKLKSEEVTRQKVLAQQRREEKLKAEEVARKKDLAQQRREEKLKAEEVARRKDLAQQRREEKLKAEEHARLQEAEQKRQEKEKVEEIARQMEEKRRAEEIEQKREEVERKREEAKRRREERQKMEEIAKKKEEALRRRQERQRSRQQQQFYPPLC